MHTHSFRSINCHDPRTVKRRKRSKSSSDIFLGSNRRRTLKRRDFGSSNSKPPLRARRDSLYSLATPTTATVHFAPDDGSQHMAVLPLNFIAQSTTKRKQKWLEAFFAEQPLFRSAFYFISLKLHELLSLTASDTQPSPFRVAMACELFSTFLERLTLRSEDAALLKRIVALLAAGVYPDISADGECLRYHQLIAQRAYFSELEGLSDKLQELHEEVDAISQKAVSRFAGYFGRLKRRRSAKLEFAVWRTFTLVQRRVRHLEITAARAQRTERVSKVFFRWRALSNERKSKLLEKTARTSVMYLDHEAHGEMLHELRQSRRESLALQAQQYQAMCKAKAGTLPTLHEGAAGEEQEEELKQELEPAVARPSADAAQLARGDLLLELSIARTNLHYFRRISESRNIFLSEYHKDNEQRLHLEICRDRIEAHLHAHEAHFGQLHHSRLLMTPSEAAAPWDEARKVSPLRALSMEQLLTRWIEFQLRRCGQLGAAWPGIDNFGEAFRDGALYWLLLHSLGLIDAVPLGKNDASLDALLDTLSELRLNEGLLLTARDVAQANTESAFVFLAQLMSAHPHVALQPEHIEADLRAMDKLYLAIDGALLSHVEFRDFAFCEAWLRKATREREQLVSLCLVCETALADIERAMQRRQALSDELNELLRAMQSFALKVLSSNRRGMRLLIADDDSVLEMGVLSTIDLKLFSAFFKGPKAALQLAEPERAAFVRRVVRACEQCLRDNMLVVRRVFREYSGRGGDTSVLSGAQLKALCVDLKIVSTFSQYQFRERVVLKADFATFLSELCYRQKDRDRDRAKGKSKPRSFAQRFRSFMEQLWASSKTLSEIRAIVALPQVQELLDTHRLGIQQIFRAQSAKAKASTVQFITKKKWMDFLARYGVIGHSLTSSMAEQAFDVCNTAEAEHPQSDNAGEELVYSEFVEALLSVALMKNNNIFVPIPKRIQVFLKQILDAAT